MDIADLLFLNLPCRDGEDEDQGDDKDEENDKDKGNDEDKEEEKM